MEETDTVGRPCWFPSWSSASPAEPARERANTRLQVRRRCDEGVGLDGAMGSTAGLSRQRVGAYDGEGGDREQRLGQAAPVPGDARGTAAGAERRAAPAPGLRRVRLGRALLRAPRAGGHALSRADLHARR